jgi:transcriptional regulator with XRE-family HTH domain
VTNDLRPTIAARTRAARKARSMTQSQLADAVARTVEAISNIERGLSLPPIDLLQRIADALDVSIADLIEASVSSGAPGERAVLEMELRSTASGLPLQHLRAAVDQIRALARLST